jgi:hypothetical protein
MSREEDLLVQVARDRMNPVRHARDQWALSI